VFSGSNFAVFAADITKGSRNTSNAKYFFIIYWI
jgi:hypothetical protein